MTTAIYCRVSTQEQAEHGHSIDEQQDRLKKYCDAMGWEDATPYIDAGFSGASTDRPALKKLLKDIHAGYVRNVVVYKLDRLSRSQKDTLYLIEDEFLKNGVDFVSMSENFDTSTPLGRAMIGILAVFAQLEREQIKERMEMGKLARAKQGRYSKMFNDPLGYDYENGALVVNDYEAMQVREMFRLYLAGNSPSKTAELLNAKGFRHRYGKWTNHRVRTCLVQRLYVGEITYHGVNYKGVHEPIIDAETWNTAQEIIKRRQKENGNGQAGVPNSYLGGLLYCAHCGGKYSKATQHAHRGEKEYHYNLYVCNSRSRRKGYMVKDPNCKNKRWRMEELDEIIFGEIRKLALDPSGYTAPADPAAMPNHNDLIREEIEKIEKQVENLIDLYAVGGIPKDALQKRIASLSEQKEQLEATLVEDSPKHGLDVRVAEAVADSLEDALDHGTYEEVRLIITTLIDKIVIDNEDITIYWNIS